MRYLTSKTVHGAFLVGVGLFVRAQLGYDELGDGMVAAGVTLLGASLKDLKDAVTSALRR